MNEDAPLWSSHTVKSQMGMGRDFTVSDSDTGEVQFLIDGKLGMRPKAEVQDASGAVLYYLRGSMLGIPKTMEITDASGAGIASLNAKFFSPVKAEMNLVMADGRAWTLLGSFLERQYEATVDGRPMIRINQKVLNVRDTFVMEVADGEDPALAAAIMWAVDRFVEQT